MKKDIKKTEKINLIILSEIFIEQKKKMIEKKINKTIMKKQ